VSSDKRGGGMDEYSRNHLRGTQFATNPSRNRKAVIERMYVRILTELAANRFKWSGLPDEIDVRFLELSLFYNALSVFFYSDDYDKYFAMQGGAAGALNMIQQPTAFRVFGNQWRGKSTLSAKDCVPIWANYVRVPDLDIVTVYASRLAEFDRTVEINAQSARQTKIVAAAENNKLSMVNINRQLDEGMNYISVNAALGDLNITALDLGVHPDQVINMHIARTRIWNECMGLLGIDNANQDKKERLVSNEVDANNDQTNMMRNVNLNSRQVAADQINKKYGLNVSVEYCTNDASENDVIEPDEDEE
jgi:hypothetical protein